MGQQISNSQIVTIAANDTPKTLRASATYICDGVADQVEIEAAAALFPSGSGYVLLLPGTFNLSAGITIASPHMTLAGSGTGSLLSMSGAGTILYVGINAWNCVIRDMTVRSYAGASVATNGIQLVGEASTVLNVNFLALSSTGFDITSGVALKQSGDRSMAANCFFDWQRGDGSPGSCVEVSGDYCSISDSSFSPNSDVSFMSGSVRSSIDSCQFVGTARLVASIKTKGGSFFIGVRNNTSHGATVHCFQIGGTGALVQGNTINEIAGASTDGINITGSNNSVIGNQVFSPSSNGRYNVRVEAGATDNLVTNNDFYYPAGAGKFSDAGTGTITVAGNR